MSSCWGPSSPFRSKMAKVWSMCRPAERLQAGMMYLRHRSYSCDTDTWTVKVAMS